MKDQGDDVVWGMVLVRPEITRFVYEYAEPRHLSPKTKVAGKTSPPLGGPGPFGQPRIYFIYSRFLDLCLWREDGQDGIAEEDTVLRRASSLWA